MQIHSESHNTHTTIVKYLWTLRVICVKLQRDALLTFLQERKLSPLHSHQGSYQLGLIKAGIQLEKGNFWNINFNIANPVNNILVIALIAYKRGPFRRNGFML